MDSYLDRTPYQDRNPLRNSIKRRSIMLDKAGGD